MPWCLSGKRATAKVIGVLNLLSVVFLSRNVSIWYWVDPCTCVNYRTDMFVYHVILLMRNLISLTTFRQRLMKVFILSCPMLAEIVLLAGANLLFCLFVCLFLFLLFFPRQGFSV